VSGCFRRRLWSSLPLLTLLVQLSGGALLLSGCGYSTIQGRAATPEMRLVVVPEAGGYADAAAVEAMVLGARAALSSEGALGEAGSPAVRVRLVRLEESTAGTRLGSVGGAETVEGRGSRLVLRGEATLVPAGGGSGPETFTAAVAEPVAFQSTTTAEARSRDDAIREMARILGRELVLRALGRSDGGTGRRAGGMWYGLAP
jgi:hypothetical protein